MPVSGGSYALPADRPDNGETSDATQIEAILQDIKDGINAALTGLANLTVAYADISGLPTTVSGYGITDAATVVQIQTGISAWATAETDADAMTATFTPTISSFTDGQRVRVRAYGANTSTTPTLNGTTITKEGNQALAAGDIPRAGYEMILVYNSSNDVLELLNPATDATISEASAAQIRSGAGGVYISPEKLQDALADVALTDAATIAVDWSSGENFSVTLTDNRVLGFPTNIAAGTWKRIEVAQDGTGSRTLDFTTTGYWASGGTAPTLSTAANAIDTFYLYARTTSVVVVFQGGAAIAQIA